jgi:hypothetical protein
MIVPDLMPGQGATVLHSGGTDKARAAHGYRLFRSVADPDKTRRR